MEHYHQPLPVLIEGRFGVRVPLISTSHIKRESIKFNMEGCLTGDVSHVLNACGAERPGFRLRHPSASFKVWKKAMTLSIRGQESIADRPSGSLSSLGN